MSYKNIKIPEIGEKIILNSQGQVTPVNCPIIPFIEGDGTGPDIWKASKLVIDAAVEKAYGSDKKIAWMEIFAGEKALTVYGEDQWLPEETVQCIRDYKIAIKGPLTTPIGGGIRSINVALRQFLDLYACVRPVRWFEGVPAPVKKPEDLDVVIFRENTEDVYSGIEFASDTPESKRVIELIEKESGKKIRPGSGIGVKPVSKEGTQRLVAKAIQYAIDQNLPTVTLVHKGNIMKFTEGAFARWGYEVAVEKFREHIITEQELWDQFDGKKPEGKILVQDRIADAMFQQLLLRPDEYSVLATLNLNGDYLSDACAAQVGGLGLAPGANIGATAAIFEATHGTAPKYANLDKINPGSVILSAVMMLEHLGWLEAAKMITDSVSKTIGLKQVTYDLARQMDGSMEVKCSEFAQLLIKNL